MKGKLGILYCENLENEMNAVLAGARFPEIVAAPMPGHVNRDPARKDRFEKAFREMASRCDQVILIGCGCWNMIVPPVVEGQAPVVTIPDPVRDLFLPPALADDYLSKGALFMVPGLVTKWREYLKAMGFSHDSDLSFLRESVLLVVLLDTGTDEGALFALQEFSEALGVGWTRVPVGLSGISRYLTGEWLKWSLDAGKEDCQHKVTAADRKSSEYAMVLEILGSITKLRDGDEVIREMLELFTVLFSPGELFYLPVSDGKPGDRVYLNGDRNPPGTLSPPVPLPEGDFQLTEEGDGFLLPLRHDRAVLGFISVRAFLFPENQNEYLNISLFIVKICALSLANAQVYQELERTLLERDQEIVERKQAENALSQANRKLNTLSSITRHDILNQILIVKAYLELIREEITDAGVMTFLDKGDKAVSTIERQITFTREYQDVGVTAPRWQDLDQTIRSAFSQLTQKELFCDTRVQGVRVYADMLVEKVFYNLLENSVRHGGHVTRVSFTVHRARGDLVLVYEDDGVGVVQEEKERIFERGFGKHTGFGMFLSREILAITGISISETGTVGQGVRFEITFPAGTFECPRQARARVREGPF